MSTPASVLANSTNSTHSSVSFGSSPHQSSAPSNIDIEAVIQAATSSSGQLSPASRDTRTQLFVGNLPYRVRWQDLKDLFRKAGTVLRADVSLGPDNRSRGYGTVLLASAEDARKAVDMFNGFSWQTRTLEVRSDRIPPDLDLSNPLNALQFSKAQNSSGHVYPFIPPINGAFVNMDPVSAQIHARAAAEAQQALGLPVASPIPPSTVPSVHLSPNLSATGAGRMLFVGNLPFHCQWQELKDLFRTAGQIVRADVALGPDGRSRGFGTVLFANEVDAAAAVAMFNGYEFNGRTLKVHHDKFSQGSDALSPSFGPLSGQSTHAPASPIPDLSLSRTGSASASAGLGSPSFAQQQMLSIHQQQPYPSSATSPTPFYISNLHSRPGSPFPPQAYAGRNAYSPHPNQTEQTQEYLDFAHTPGAPPHHMQRHGTYAEHLRSTLATPPPAPLRPPPSARSSGRSSDAISPTDQTVVNIEIPSESTESPDLSSEPIRSTIMKDLPRQTSSLAGVDAGTATSSMSAIPSKLSGSRKKMQGNAGADSRRPPGTISLPPSHAFSVNPLSPHMTRGIPITPSMPGFTFHAPMSTPPLPHHLLSPGLGPFSPPVPFYNPYLNAAPGAPLHVGGQHEGHQSMFAGVSSVFGPPSPHHMIPSQISPLHHPMPGPEYFQMPGSPHDHPASGYFQPPVSQPPLPSQAQRMPAASSSLNQPSPSEPPDYFAGTQPAPAPLPPSLPIGRTSSGGMGSTGRGSDGTGPSTIPSSSGASSPLGGNRHAEASISSRGTSLPADSDDFAKNTVLDSPPPGTMESRTLQHHHVSSASGTFTAPNAASAGSAHHAHGRAKSQSPNENVPSLNLGHIQGNTASSPLTERRMSWNDISGLQRRVARMSLEGKSETDNATTGRNWNR